MGSNQPKPQPSGGQLADARTATAARKNAATIRAEHLQLVTSGLLAVWDVIVRAEDPNNQALQKITLNQLLLAQPGWGRATVDKKLEELNYFLELEQNLTELRKLKISWLLSPKVKGKRLLVLLEILQKKQNPHPGFPYSSATPQ